MITTEKQVQEIEEFLKSIALSVQVIEGIDLDFVNGWRYVKEDINLCDCMFRLSHSYELSGNSSHVIGFFNVVIEKGVAIIQVSEIKQSQKKVDNIEELKEFFSVNVDVAIEILKMKKDWKR